MLWAQVVFYIILIHGVARVCGLEILGKYILFELSPHNGAYWYFNAYTYLFFLIPLLNAGLTALKKPLLLLCISLFSLCCLTGGHYEEYTILLVMYLIGGYLRLHPVHIKVSYGIAATVISLFLTAGFAFANHFDLVYKHSFLPTVITTLALFLLVLKIPFTSSSVNKIISTLAPLSFGCYLLQCHPFMWRHVLNDTFRQIAAGNPLPWVILMTIALFVGGLILDALRQQLFNLLRLKSCAEKADSMLERLFSHCR